LVSPTNPWVALQGLNVLRKNEVLFMLFDAPSTTRNIEVNFLGRRVAFPSGPAVLAKRSGAPLLNFYVYRADPWVPQIAEIGTPFYVNEDIAAAVQHYVSCLEDKILQHPANWCTWLAREWQRTAVNTEAKYLLLKHAFETLGCIRVELKTDSLNEKSRAAILRIGAREEGIFRNHMITAKGRIRHTVYFSIVDPEWPAVKARLESLLRSRQA